MASLGRVAESAASRIGDRHFVTAATSSLTRAASIPLSFLGSSNKAPFSGDSQNFNHGRNNLHDEGTADINDDEDRDNFGMWKPNQITTIFREMEISCPDVMRAYAQCVVEKQNSGALIQGACDVQFTAVMDCFRSARIKGRGNS